MMSRPAGPSARGSTTRPAHQGDRGRPGEASRPPRPGSASPSCCSASWWPPTRPPAARSPRSTSPPSVTTATMSTPGSKRWARAPLPPPTPSWPRPSAMRPSTRRPHRSPPPSAPSSRPRARDQGCGPFAHEEAGPPAHRRRGPAHRRAHHVGHPTPLGEVDLFPTAHGSALFQRGETQVVNVTTSDARMNQLLDTISPDDTKRYMHHYNFPPFSTGRRLHAWPQAP